MFKNFEKDRLLRNSEGVPVARVILAVDAEHVDGKIAVAALKAPKQFFDSILGGLVYVDGEAYRIPSDLHPIKVQSDSTDYLLNSFYLEKSD